MIKFIVAIALLTSCSDFKKKYRIELCLVSYEPLVFGVCGGGVIKDDEICLCEDET